MKPKHIVAFAHVEQENADGLIPIRFVYADGLEAYSVLTKPAAVSLAQQMVAGRLSPSHTVLEWFLKAYILPNRGQETLCHCGLCEWGQELFDILNKPDWMQSHHWTGTDSEARAEKWVKENS